MEFSGELAKLDKAVALERLGGDEDLLKEVAGLFLQEYPELVSQIREAIDQNDAHKLERSAHSLKGSVSNFGSDAAWEAALELEKMGRSGKIELAEPAYSHLMAVMDGIRPELMDLAK